MKAFLIAISFLTRIPYRTEDDIDDKTWQDSLIFYPFCGFIIGLLSVLPFIILILLNKTNYFYINDLAIIAISAFLYVVISEYMTRLLHFDGFCDCLDAFSAMTISKERRLEIMKDPLVGSSGVAGGALLLTGKIICLLFLSFKYIYFSGNHLELIILLMLVPMLARFSIVLLASIGKYPRKSGTAFSTVGKVGIKITLFAFVTILPIMGIDIRHWIMFVIILLSVFYWKKKSDKALGGVTGDVLGACCETAELAMLFVILL